MPKLILLSNQGKRGAHLGLSTMKVDIEDTTYLSKYFVVAEFNTVFTSGRNAIAFNGSSFLKGGEEIKVECIDSNGNSLYLEYPISNIQFIDVAKFVISIHVYNETYNGPGKIILVGTTVNGEIVRWMSNVSIDKTLHNVSKTRLYSTPTIEARSLLYPVIDPNIGTGLTKQLSFSGSFYSYAITPPVDTFQFNINPKLIDVDYKMFYNSPSNSFISPQLYPTKSFNSQMDGQTITYISNIVKTPYSYVPAHAHFTASSIIKKVIDSKTIQLTTPFFINYRKDHIISNINDGIFSIAYNWVSYNTQSDVYQKYTPPSGSGGSIIYAKKSYAEIVYRNIKPFTGYIARHKLYRKSSIYPGDFTLIADEPIGIREMLVDPITINKTYNLMGKFYNQTHINKYWFTSSNTLYLSHSVSPHIDAMKIGTTESLNNIDGTKYVIVKTDSVDTLPNNAGYIPYDETQFNELQGLAYNSNFIDLKANSLYVLSTNISIEKDKSNINAKVQFFFTSSTPSIIQEPTYIPSVGMKLGEIVLSDLTTLKNFSDKQMLFFTPLQDYYGTLVIVPYQCNITLSELSLGIYVDYGFSPDTLITKVPFDITIAGEPFQIKAELFDVNSTLVYSNLQTVQTFDAKGESLFTFVNGGSNYDPTKVTGISGSLTISQSLFLPHLSNCLGNTRLVGYTIPTHSPPNNTDGKICYTNISDISVSPTTTTTPDYINITTVQGITNITGKSIAVNYTGNGSGKRIYIDSNGVKHTYQ